VTDLADFQELRARLTGKVNDHALELFEDDYKVGEWALAIEDLCDNIGDAGEAVPEPDIPLLRKLGTKYSVERNSFVKLTQEYGRLTE
jgi:hypothetical protein